MNETLVENLVNKHSTSLKSLDRTVDSTKVIAFLLENLDKSGEFVGFPADLIENLKSLLVDNLLRLQTFKLVSVQPMTDPVGAVAYYKLRTPAITTEDGVPTLSLDIKIDTVSAKAREITTEEGVISPYEVAPVDVYDKFYSKLRKSIDNTTVSNILKVAKRSSETVSLKDNSLRLLLSQASTKMFRRNQRAPANFVIVNPNSKFVGELFKLNTEDVSFIGTIATKFSAFTSPVVPKSSIIMGYKGPSILDAGVIWSPYCINVTNKSIRESYTSANDDFYTLLKIK